ncbi:IS256 family transposase [Kordia algicida OT-1]|uniref:Mutator family transposase n=1 Tax=Kordia algicida OT-1 TaxID=391587 RepID=A9E6W7_9FLAO|nr:IS256 family transposase [Kordia algicida]EDP95098.1 methionyl-tRNA formyltransferase [Kordia algicida OT-1]
MKKEDVLSDEFFKQFKDGKELQNFLSSLHKRGIEKILEGELDAHLGYSKHEKKKRSNSRNGYSKKTIKTDFGTTEITVPRDRNASFDPILIPKRSSMTKGIENVIISLYAKGMSNRDIEDQVRDIYDIEVSRTTISRITDRISEDAIAWQHRPLESVYLIVWMDGILFKVREDSKVINKTIYIAAGLRRDGVREVLGLWLGKNESASFWLSVLTDIKARGVEDILISVTDNLKGFTETVTTVFPNSRTQICVVHQIRNACKFVIWRDRKSFTESMRNIYMSPNIQAAEAALDDFANKWSGKYHYAVRSWQSNWEALTVFFDFPVEIRRIIYTTNLMESLNRRIRKYTKNKSSFPTDSATMKMIYLAIGEATKSWEKPIKQWGIIINQFLILFKDRMQM